MDIVINEYSFSINQKTTANRLKELRKERNLSLSEMSDCLVNQNKYLFNIEDGNDISETIRSWESGKRRPGREKMIALCNFFNISLQELVLPNSICKSPKPRKIKLSSDNINEFSKEELSYFLENKNYENIWIDYLIQKLVCSYLNDNDICLFLNILFGMPNNMDELYVDPIQHWNKYIDSDLEKNGVSKFDMTINMKEEYTYYIYKNIIIGFKSYNRKGLINLVYNSIIMNYNESIRLLQLLNEIERSIVFTSLILVNHIFLIQEINYFCNNKTKFLNSIADFESGKIKVEDKLIDIMLLELGSYSYEDYMNDSILVTEESIIKIKEQYNYE